VLIWVNRVAGVVSALAIVWSGYLRLRGHDLSVPWVLFVAALVLVSLATQLLVFRAQRPSRGEGDLRRAGER
jgi:uncharacterized membrane protein (UPF0136 family)